MLCTFYRDWKDLLCSLFSLAATTDIFCSLLRNCHTKLSKFHANFLKQTMLAKGSGFILHLGQKRQTLPGCCCAFFCCGVIVDMSKVRECGQTLIFLEEILGQGSLLCKTHNCKYYITTLAWKHFIKHFTCLFNFYLRLHQIFFKIGVVHAPGLLDFYPKNVLHASSFVCTDRNWPRMWQEGRGLFFSTRYNQPLAVVWMYVIASQLLREQKHHIVPLLKK